MDDYAGRVLADRYRLPLPPSDEYELTETRAFDTYSGQEVLVRQVPLPEVVEAEVLDAEGLPEGFTARERGARRATDARAATRRPADPAVRRAVEAAQAAARIPDHPRLDQVFDVFAEGGSLWVVSEWVAARPLSALLAEQPLSPYRAAEVASDVIMALRVLHAHGWVHRNITARTVLVCEDGRVMLTGLAVGAAEEALSGYDPVPGQDEPDEGGPGAGPGGGSGGAPFAGQRAVAPGAGGRPGEAVGGPAGAVGAGGGDPAGAGGVSSADVDPEAARRAAIQARAAGGLQAPGVNGVSGGAGAPGPAGQRALETGADVRAARAGAIAAYREGARAAARVQESWQTGRPALPGARPPAEDEAGADRAERAERSSYPGGPGLTTPPGRTADPYGVQGPVRPGAAPRTATTGGTTPALPGTTPALPVATQRTGLPPGDPRPAHPTVPGQTSTPAVGPTRGPGPGHPGSTLSPYGTAPGGEGSAPPSYGAAPDREGSAPYGTGSAHRTGADPLRQGRRGPEGPHASGASGWEDAGALVGPRRGPATALAAERARQVRMTVVGPVTERWAPEQAGPVHENWQLAAPIGPATDLWALGALLFRAVQGHAPYPEESTAELVQLVCAEPPAFAEECGPLRPVVESLLRQDPTERLDFEELSGWLRSLVRSAPEPDAGTRVVSVPPADPRRLPIVRRRGELVRLRRRRAGLSEAPSHGRHKRARQEARSPRSLGRILLLLILLLLAGAVVYAMLFLPKQGHDGAAGGDRTGSTGQASPEPSRTRQPSSGQSADGGPSASGPATDTQTGGDPSVADGFTLRTDPEGFKIAVAKGWDRTPKNGSGEILYTQGNFELIVVPGRDGATTYGSDPMAYQRDKESELQPYRDSSWATATGLRTIEVGERTMAEGQFTWTDGQGRDLFVRNMAILLNGRYHIIQVRGPEAQRDKVTQLYEQATATYRYGG
ncbi:protein kinase [Streptomyces broussonetiae]|uniref:Protein kinase n=1 Tax=Streptomyces broussonetiae TaxID=2686304 RepID=A0A6I6N790_9ACTN|nr:protein kinase [Streptomyces broussonetiae]QHA06351.1 protein kinase [Streptomyces broussonetiae]